jgi:hypothetical protein
MPPCVSQDVASSLYFRHKGEIWSAAEAYPPYSKESDLSKPKPDFTYAFNIYDIPSDSKGFWRGDTARNFSLELLSHLCAISPGGLLSSPRAKLEKLPECRERSAWALTCFPWAIVESKKENHDIQFCYRQAVNAASVALRMFQGLMQAKYILDDDNIPPVIAFTTIGQNVRLWLAYCSKTEDGTSEYVSSKW